MSEITSVQEDKMQDVVIDPIAEKDVETSTEDEESGMLHVHTADPSLASDGKTFLNTLIAFLGSGVLGIPFVFKETGILLGVFTLIFVASINTFCMLLIVRCKYELRKRGEEVNLYSDIGYAVMGKAGACVVNIAIIFSQTGFCVSYLIFIATNVHAYLGVPREAAVAICLPLLIVFSLVRHLKQLAYAALVADIMNLTGLAVVYSVDFEFMAYNDDQIKFFGVISSLPFFFGVASYCFEGVGMVLPLEKSMRNKQNFSTILIATMVIITTIYATFGICGYLAFGETTKDVLTLNMENGGEKFNFLTILVNVCLCVGLFFTYPLMLVPVFEIMQSWIHSPNTEESLKKDDVQRSESLAVNRTSHSRTTCLRSSAVLLTGLIAAGVPDFGPFISFIGATCCSLLAYVLPTFFYLHIFYGVNGENTPWYHDYYRIGLLLIGALGVASMFHGVLVALI
ncbi:hypothetical protein ABG067_002980 [Albugo candida]